MAKKQHAPPVLTDAELLELCANWRTLNAQLLQLDRLTLERAIRLERRGRNRPYILIRMHTRLQRLKSREEWDQLVADEPRAARG